MGALFVEKEGDPEAAIREFCISEPGAETLAQHSLMFYKKYGDEFLDSIKDYEATLAFECADALRCESVYLALQLFKRAPKSRITNIG